MKLGVIGIDEVGRGPLAGPVTVCAAYIKDTEYITREYFGKTIRDSKKLSFSLRNNIYQTIRKNKKSNIVIFAVSSRSALHIDKYGINKSIHDCMVSCLKSLRRQGVDVTNTSINLDGGLKIQDSSLKQTSFVKGDEKYVEIAVASVIAKVTRDRYMIRLSKEIKGYDFEHNLGYGTKKHRDAIKKLGRTKYHRNTYLSRI